MLGNKKITIFFLSLVLLSGCEGKSSDSSRDIKIANDQEYNLMITNNSPLFLKSVVVTVNEKDNNILNSLIGSNVNYGENAKFKIKKGEHVFKIKINPKKNYSVSKEFSEDFEDEKVVEYVVEIKENEVVIHKKD
ncbi:hypothetical protein [Paenibacillus tepidiphilus]|uniref:hypothetical protein n=1 Tax=Paenibacillus tepidiphilus TaxID=2608683 RepID=UPI00123B21C0|nr:hypothetical protein [Paenibacillus tepidiphilus]